MEPSGVSALPSLFKAAWTKVAGKTPVADMGEAPVMWRRSQTLISGGHIDGGSDTPPHATPQEQLEGAFERDISKIGAEKVVGGQGRTDE